MVWRLLLIYCFVLVTPTSEAQQNNKNSSTHFNMNQGLSGDYITAIHQDSTGFLWIATTSGLNRYDGKQFVRYHSTNDNTSLPAEEITGANWLDENRLGFFGTGLHIVNTRTAATQNIFIPYHQKKYQFKFNVVMAAKGDEAGNVYVLTRSGFYHFDKNNKLLFRYDYFPEDQVAITHFYFGSNLYTLDKHRLLIVAAQGLYIYDRVSGKFQPMKPNDCPLLAEFIGDDARKNAQFLQVKPSEFFIIKTKADSVLYIDLSRNIKQTTALETKGMGNEFGWRTKIFSLNDTVKYITGHRSGFYKLQYTPAGNYLKLYPEKLFKDYLCTSILKDADNNLWIGTNRGLLKNSAGTYQVEKRHIVDGLEKQYPNLRINQMHVAHDKLYVGTHEAGLLVYDKKNLKLVAQIADKQYAGNNSVIGIAPVSSNELLLGTLGDVLVLHAATLKTRTGNPAGWNNHTDWTSCMLLDKKGNVWLGADKLSMYNYAKRSFVQIPEYQKLLDIPSDMAEDKEGNIWMSCHGLARYNTKKGYYDRYIDSFPFIKMPDKQVNSLTIDANDKIWFGSNNNGLISYDIHKKTYRHYTTVNGLPDNNVFDVLAVGGHVWIACYSGLACIDIHSGQITAFGKEDGFPVSQIPKGSRLFFDETDNLMYAGFTDTILRFQPDKVLLPKKAPRVFIENIAFPDKRKQYLPGNKVNISWRDDGLIITIGSIGFNDGITQRFAYRILNNNNAGAWVSLGTQNSFSLGNLQPGEYQVQVKVYSPKNRWPEQIQTLSLVVSAPFWKQYWFFLIIGFVLGLLIYWFVKWRVKAAEKKERVKTHIETLKAEHYKNQFELEQISNYFSSSLSHKHTIDEVLWDVAENLIGRMNYEDCVIYLWNNDKTKMQQKAAWGPKGKPEIIAEQTFEVLPGQGIVGTVIETKQPVIVNDTTTDERYRVDDQYRLSEVAVPIIHDNELLGVIDAEHSELNYFTDRDIKILTTIATLIGNKMEELESKKSLAAKQKELAGINEQLAEARLSALQAQMNPHFVFNALNSIKRMILDEANDNASRYMSKFALMIRLTLEHSKNLFVTMDESIEYIKAYLDMEKLRFGDTFTYTIGIDENLETSEVVFPSMMIQPIVENAIWHGLMHNKGDKHILISFELVGEKILCIIEDNGIGLSQSKKLKESNRPLHRSVGLENLHKRINIMNEKYQTDCSFRMEDLCVNGNNATGTRVTMQLNRISIY